MAIQRLVATGFNSSLLTLGLLFLMYQLIKIDEPELQPLVNFMLPPISLEAEETVLKPIVVKPPEPAPVQEAPTVTRDAKVDIDALVDPVPWTEPSFRNESGGLPLPENQLVLVLGYPPEYPQRAITARKEGYTVVAFSVDQSGQVFNARIIDSQPAGVFDRASLKAIAKFRYKPRMQGGKAIVTHDQRYKFTFKLDD